MAFDNNNKDKKVLNHRTYGPALFNKDTMQKLKVGFNNQFVEFSISKINEFFKDVQGTEISVSFTGTKAADLLDDITFCKGRFKEKQSFSRMVEMGLKELNAIQFCDGAVLGAPYGFYVLIHKNIQPDGHASTTGVYKCADGYSVENYDHVTGEGTKIVKPLKDVKEIERLLEEYCKASSKSLTHIVLDTSKFRHDYLSNSMKVISMLLGGGIDNVNKKPVIPAADIFAFGGSSFEDDDDVPF